MEDHVEREFCSEEGKEPLGSIHVCFKANVQKVVIQIRNVFLIVKNTQKYWKLISTIWNCSLNPKVTEASWVE